MDNFAWAFYNWKVPIFNIVFGIMLKRWLIVESVVITVQLGLFEGFYLAFNWGVTRKETN